MRFSGREIDLATFDVLWELALGDTPRPHVLDCPSPGETTARRDAVVRAGWDELRASGYLDGDEVHPVVVDLLHVLARPTLAADVRLFHADRPNDAVGAYGARVAHRGERGAAGLLRPDGFTLWSIRPTAIQHEVRALLGEWQAPQRFASTTVWAQDLRDGRAAMVPRLGPWQRRWHVTVSSYNRALATKRVSWALTGNDTPYGRFLAIPRQEQITIVAGKPAVLTERIGQMIKSVRPN